MIKKIFTFLLLSVILLPLTASAASFHSGDTFLLGKEESLTGDLYTAGNSVTVEGAVTGDLNEVGGTILFSGKVSQDLQAAGGTLTLVGGVGDDLRAAGGSITVGSKVSGDALLAGGQVTLLPGSAIEGDLVAGGGKISVSGFVGGNARVYGNEVVIDGEVLGPITVRAEKLTIGSHAVLHGNLSYSSPQEATVVSGADVRGQIAYEPRAALPNKENMKEYLAALFGIWFGLKMLMLLLASLLVCLYFRKAAERVAADTFSSFGSSLLLGFAFLVAVPVAAIILFITLVGGMLGVLLLFVYAAILLGVSIYVPAVVGSELLRYWRKEPHLSVSALGIVVGVVAMSLLSLLPVVGHIVAFVLFLAVLGSALRYKWGELQNYR